MSTPVPFWDSNLLLIIVTAVAGAITYFIYVKQRIDSKKDAASIILLEIKRAEQKLKEAKQLVFKDEKMPETVFAMKTANWSKYSYLFVRNFTAEEWNIIDEFYEKCRLYDEVVKYNNMFSRKNEEQTRINLQHALAEYIQSYLTKLGQLKAKHKDDSEQLTTQTKKEYEHLQELLTSFSDNFISYIFTPGTRYFYNPVKAFNDAKFLIETTQMNLSTSTVGTKLETIINETSRQRFARWLSGAK